MMCNECNCCRTDRDSKCQYYLLSPPIFLDFLFNRFRQPCLGILCILIMTLYGTQSTWNNTLRTCDQLYIINPTCMYEDYSLTIFEQVIPTQYELVTLSQQNDISIRTVMILDQIFTIIIILSNSQYHSPLWLIPSLAGTSYTTYLLMRNMDYCHKKCVDSNNNVYKLDMNLCNEYLNETLVNNSWFINNHACNTTANDLHICRHCQCQSLALNNCNTRINTNTIIDLSLFRLYTFYVLITLRQISGLALLVMIFYEFLFGSHDYSLFLCCDCRSNKINSNETSTSQDTLSLLVKMTNPSNLSNKICSIIESIKHPISIRLAIGNIVSIIFMVLVTVFYNAILPDVLRFIFSDVIWAKYIILVIIWVCYGISIIIGIRSMISVHKTFMSDVTQVYKHYLSLMNNKNGIELSLKSHNNAEFDSLPQWDTHVYNSLLFKHKNTIFDNNYCDCTCIINVFNGIWPRQVGSNANILNDVKNVNIMKAYRFIFVYPFSILVGINLLFIMTLIPITFIGIIIFSIANNVVPELLEAIYIMLINFIEIFWPILLLYFYNKCVLKSSADVLETRYVRCFWLATFIDLCATFASSLAVGAFTVLCGRVGYSLYILMVGLLRPQRPCLPKAYHLDDSVYNTYVANIAVTVLSLLKANDNHNNNESTYSDIIKLTKGDQLLLLQQNCNDIE